MGRAALRGEGEKDGLGLYPVADSLSSVVPLPKDPAFP